MGGKCSNCPSSSLLCRCTFPSADVAAKALLDKHSLQPKIIIVAIIFIVFVIAIIVVVVMVVIVTDKDY